MMEQFAKVYKPYFGTTAYDIAKYKCLFKGLYDY
jgi:hypothetical protein